MDSGVHPSLHSNCHHQIIYAKFNLKGFYPPYERTVWHFSRTNSGHIKKAIHPVDWESSLNNLKVNEQVSVFNETIVNILSNFVPNELITCDDRDLPRMNRYIKNVIAAINDFHKKFVLPSSNIANLLMFKDLQNQLIQSIHTAKQRYFNKISKTLCDPLTSTKCYWSLWKTTLNEKKVPCIPPIYHNNKYVTDFKEKSEIFNSFLANQCSLIPNNSMLPSELKLLAEHTWTSCDFSESDILQIINQDSNKDHGHDMISIRMLNYVVRQSAGL